MIHKRFFPALAALVMLGACATATPYQAAGSADRGYSEQKIESNRWMVSFSGNSLTDRRTVETYLLYRAAELTTQNGFDHFRMVRRDTDEDSSFVPLGGTYSHFRPYYHRAYYDPWYHSRFDPWGPAEYREVTRFEANAEIQMGSGAKPDDPAYFDAADVIANLSGNIQRPAEG